MTSAKNYFTAALLYLLAWPVWADDVPPLLPALYNVSGVAGDDVLNIRAEPNGSAEIIGSLAPDARSIEVVGFSRAGEWALVNNNGQSGWISVGYIEPQEMIIGFGGLPEGLHCFGTEPFWSLEIKEAGVIFEGQSTPTTYEITYMSPSAEYIEVRETGLRIHWGSGENATKAHILPGLCSDGMSDSTYGLHYIDNRMMNKGCCSISN